MYSPKEQIDSVSVMLLTLRNAKGTGTKLYHCGGRRDKPASTSQSAMSLFSMIKMQYFIEFYI
jgi:hypothetical protein